ncbi:MAG: DNA repair protein RadC [Clostridiales bacterium]|nr:DNA repair protein RadC [Clostridiales bacterium]
MHRGHRDRVKNRFLNEGLDGFEDHQILELLLFYSIPMRDTNELAHMLIDRYGSLSGVLEADVADLMTIPGIGKNSAVFLSLMPSVARRYFKDRWRDKPQIASTTKAGEYLISLFAGRLYELFYIICLDAQNRVNHAALVHEGTIDQAAVYPRLIVETALRHQSHSVLIAHNHPGGSLKPSAADIEVTNQIKRALEPISIRILDHIIVAGDKYFSFADSGLI